jgi:cephalosporin hydroxylase
MQTGMEFWMNTEERKVTDAFHDLYYNGPQESGGNLYLDTYWMGTPCQKCPLDLWIYQEILFEMKPDLIIETGTHSGGSALFLAHLCDIMGHGKVVTIDLVERPPRPTHERIIYLDGSSSDPDVIAKARAFGGPDDNVLVILDSDHSEQHVLQELELLSPFVKVGGYLIVEDSNINGHPTFPAFGPGPFEAIEKFLASNPGFVVDVEREKFLMTFNPSGYLKRIA